MALALKRSARSPIPKMRLLSSLFGRPTSWCQTRCSILIVPASRLTCFHFRPSTSEIRAPVAIQVSMMSLFGSSNRASTRAVSLGIPGKSERDSGMMPNANPG